MSTATATGPSWDAVRDQPAVLGVFRQALDQHEVSHAWLLCGPPAVGQREAVLALTADLNDPGGGDASVRGRIQRGVHPNLLEFVPTGPEYLVRTVREEWIPAASRTLSEGRVRVVRIVAAHRMNEAAQNAFLKVLEEPPASTIWVLEADDEAGLLDTIVSRCRRVDFTSWKPDALADVAREAGLDEHEVLAVTRTAEGSPDRVRAIADRAVVFSGVRENAAAARGKAEAALEKAKGSSSKKAAAAERKALRDIAAADRQADLPHRLGREIVGRLADVGPAGVLDLAAMVVETAGHESKAQEARNTAELADLRAEYERDGGMPKGVRALVDQRHRRAVREAQRRAYDAVLDDLGSWLRDLLCVQVGGGADAVVHVDRLEVLRREADLVRAADVPEIIAAITTAREALDRNGQPLLQFESLLLTVLGTVLRARR